MIHEPQNLTDEQKKEIVAAHRYKVEKGGSISCGHDFWDKSKDKPAGDIFLCTRCYQYFVKMSGLPWWSEPRQYYTKGDKLVTYEDAPRSNHLDGICFHPVDIRCQDGNGNDIVKRN